jgi:hypothetical protein
MTAFFLVVAIGIAIFVFSNMKSSHADEIANLCKSIVEKWVTENDGKLDTLMFKTYNDPTLTTYAGGLIFVGQFRRNRGDSCGFYIEIVGGEIGLGRLFFPDGITSWHASLAREAKINSVTLYDALILAEERHHIKFPEWKDIR